jgi:hypothetical protein
MRSKHGEESRESGEVVASFSSSSIYVSELRSAMCSYTCISELVIILALK